MKIMKRLNVAGALVGTMFCMTASAQKTVADATISYSVSSQGGAAKNDALDGATSVVYLRTGLSRVDMTSTLGKETTIYDSKVGTGAILKEYSGQKLMVTLTKDNWVLKNARFDGVVFETTAETKQVAGYNCKKATAKLKEGSVTVYYAPDISLSNKDALPLFKTLAGLPVQYELQNGGMTFIYTLTKIDFNPVPAAKFDYPKSGYRVMTYDENVQQKKS